MPQSQPVIWRALNIFMNIARALPHEKAVSLGSVLGGLVPLFTKKKFGEAVQRCADVLHIERNEAYQIVRRSYKHFGRDAAEFARLPMMADKLDSLVTLYGADHLDKALAHGRGVILATAHIGNWEYAAAYLAHKGYKVRSLGTDQRDSRITELIKELRSAGGSTPLGKADDLRAVIASLKAGDLLAVPIDQDAKQHGVAVPFLGRMASTPQGPAKLAARLGCAVLAGICVRQPDGISFKIELTPQFEEAGGMPFGKDIAASLTKLNDYFSDAIRKYPDQWMWMYPRWESVERGLFS
ncbi:MAG: lysophospholipid acyltransferase family protein [Synergistes sp.]|nr:lysophospholipid acyltransferase family protein [Synergistes sp.]